MRQLITMVIVGLCVMLAAVTVSAQDRERLREIATLTSSESFEDTVQSVRERLENAGFDIERQLNYSPDDTDIAVIIFESGDADRAVRLFVVDSDDTVVIHYSVGIMERYGIEDLDEILTAEAAG